jgi:formylglycine-generating enzyme required for sulfatase activity
MQHASRITLVTALLLSVALVASAQDKKDDKKSPMTAAERIALLKTFNSEFVAITPGTGKFPASFVMGSSEGEPSEQPARTVKLAGAFSIAKYEVPQNLWEAVMGSNPSKWTGPRNSVEMLSWRDAMVFCQKATAMMRQAKLIEAGEGIRLPSEAEWEYCCRAGTTTAYSFGPKARAEGDAGNKASRLDPYGWHTANASGNDPPVGALKPNPWGLYDMHGYLSEFVLDAWHADYKGAPGNSGAWDSKNGSALRIIRSGSWRNRYPSLRSAARVPLPDHVMSDAIGLRCVKVSTSASNKKKTSK